MMTRCEGLKEGGRERVWRNTADSQGIILVQGDGRDKSKEHTGWGDETDCSRRPNLITARRISQLPSTLPSSRPLMQREVSPAAPDSDVTSLVFRFHSLHHLLSLLFSPLSICLYIRRHYYWCYTPSSMRDSSFPSFEKKKSAKMREKTLILMRDTFFASFRALIQMSHSEKLVGGGRAAFSTYCYFYLDEKRNSWYIGFRAIRTAFLSMCRDLKLGSKSNWLGSIFIGDWRRPLLHMAQSGFIKPQNAGPVSQKEEQGKEDFISKTFYC